MKNELVTHQMFLRNFFEDILLSKMSLDSFNNLQDYINAMQDRCVGLAEAFCQYFDLGQGMLELIDRLDFPFEQWWEEYALERPFK